MIERHALLLLFLFNVLAKASSQGQFQRSDTLLTPKKQPNSFQLYFHPQNKANFEKPGKYELVLRMDKNEIEAGDSVTMELYITGYGHFGLGKLFFLPTMNWYDLEHSTLITGMQVDQIKHQFFWGHDTASLNAQGFLLTLGGVEYPDTSITIFIDAESIKQDLSISTEYKIKKLPPFLFKFATLSDLEPGNYTVNFVFTYFNGQDWQNSQQTGTIKIKNVFERNVRWTWFFGILALISIIEPVIRWGKSLLTALKRKLESRDKKLVTTIQPEAKKTTKSR